MSAEDADVLLGARVQRVDTPHPSLVAITIYHRGARGTLLLSTSGRGTPLGYRDQRPRGAAVSAFGLRLRKWLTGARLVTFDESAARFEFLRGEERSALYLRSRPTSIAFEADGNTTCLGDPGGEPATLSLSMDALVAAGHAIAHEAEHADQDGARHRIERALSRRRRALHRRLEKIDGDLHREAEIAELRLRGTLLLTHLATLSKETDEALLTDWSTDPPRTVTIAIDRRLGPRRQADALFKRARKLERGAAIAEERRRETERTLERVDAILRALPAADEAALADYAEASRALGAMEPRETRGSPRVPIEGKPYRTFRASDGGAIWVGRSAKDNDALTLRHARPWDLWLHVRDYPGSHVVVPLERGQTCPPERLLDAAHLAAHYSSAPSEDQARVEITHTERRYVRKPRSAAIGAVTLQRERVLMLRFEVARLQRLIRGEAPDPDRADG